MPPTDEDLEWIKSTFHPIPKPVLPEDSIEYSIYVFSIDNDSLNDSELRLQLRNVQKRANELQKQWLKDYIWQRQGFSLEVIKEDGEVGVRNFTRTNDDLANTSVVGLSFLRGRTEYGDSIEDEWAITWLLREVSKSFKNAWVKVSDSDGEFLLIEASGTIPAWLEPDIAENRVWINDGQLKILKPIGTARSSKRTGEKLSLQDAQKIILREPKRIMHSVSIEEEAFYRLRNYPQQISDNMHHALVTLPRKVAFLLLQKPAYISPAIEAFYLRDPIALKPLQKKGGEADLVFIPTDLVTLSLRFPRVGYAQVKSQDFPIPPAWAKVMPSKLEDKDYARTEVGMKVTSGFEMFLSDNQHQDKQSVREMKMLLEDLETGDELLPTDDELAKLDRQEDDEKWLDISLDDLDRELGGKSKASGEGKKQDFGDKSAQENLQRIVKQFEDFLNNDKDGPDEDGMFVGDSDDDLGDDDSLGDEDEEDDSGEDKEGSFDEAEFTAMMQQMMGMPPEVMKEITSGTIDALRSAQRGDVPAEVQRRARSKVEEVDSDDEADIQDLKQMEAELQASGALDLKGSKQKGVGRNQALLNNSQDKNLDEDSSLSSDDDQGVNDFDADFARNILASFKSGGGMGGPAASLLSMMDEQAESSKPKTKAAAKK